MMSLCCHKNQWIVFLLVVGVFLASAFLFLSMANAAEEAQIQAAIQDLGSATGQNITTEDQAKDLCNQEQYLDVCADIGKKHELYEPEELKQVDSFLSEVKGKILDDIKNCDSEECLIKVATELANKIKTKNPTLATDLNLTTVIVAEKKAVVQAAQEVGVNFKDCESMDPDIAPVDLLRKCARLAKDARVQKYIPEEKRVLADQFGDTTIKLREVLSTGKYQCGDGTLEGCGNYCLNPDAATRAAGIPTVCTQIANEVFGQEGVKQLETSYQQVGQVKDYYSKKFILTLPDGSELVGEGQIRNACDKAFALRNIELAKACGNFAVNNGFASQADVDRGLKMVESFIQKAPNVKFEQCITAPETCREFIPEEERSRFDAGSQIFEIMRTEIGFDPQQCERGATDQAIGTKCFEGSKRALAKIEGLGLAAQSREAGFIIEDIKRHVADGEKMMAQKGQFEQVFNQQGGPGGCKSAAECFAYCSNPTNGPECIAFGSQQNVSGFQGEQAIQKFQEYNQNVQKSSDVTSNEYRAYPSDGRYSQLPGQGPYPGFQPPGQGGYVPGQYPGFTQPGPGFSPSPGVGGFYPGPGPGPAGPSPECFAAIQSGDFNKAKTICSSPNLSIPLPTTPICPAPPYVECPVGQYRESFRNENGCWVDGPCKSAPTYSPGPYPTYSSQPPGKYQCSDGVDNDNDGKTDYPADSSCYGPDDSDEFYPPEGGPYPSGSVGPYPTYSPSSGQKNQVWNSKGLNSYIRADADPARIEKLKTVCANVSGGTNIWMPGAGDSSSNDFGMPDPVKCQKAASCTSGQYFDGSSCVGSIPYPTYSYSPYPTSTGGAGGIYSCFYTNAIKNGKYPGYTIWCEKDYFNCHEGSKTGPLISLDGLALGAPSSCESGWQTSSSPYPTYSPYPTSGSCPSGYHYHGESGGFCMNDQENYGGTCYNAAGTSKITCPQPTYSPYPSPSGTPTGGGSCPSGSHTMYVNNAGGYCMSDSDGNKCGPLSSTSVSGFGSCSSYQGSTTYSPYPSYSPGTSYTPAPSCPSGQWWDYSTNSCQGSTTTYTPPPYTPPPSCSSGQYWDGSSCVTNPTPYPTTEYTPPPTYSEPPPPPPPSEEPPPPTSTLYPHYMAMHCQQLGRTWNGRMCEANGLFARFFEGSGMANALRLFYIIP